VRAGRLRHRISVYRDAAPVKVNGVLVTGDPKVVIGSIPAEIMPATQGNQLLFVERLQASSTQALPTHIVTIRAPRSWQLRHTDRVVWHDGQRGDRLLQVLGAQDPDGRDRDLVFAAMEQVA
jgi:head-tail adaptor